MYLGMVHFLFLMVIPTLNVLLIGKDERIETKSNGLFSDCL